MMDANLRLIFNWHSGKEKLPQITQILFYLQCNPKLKIRVIRVLLQTAGNGKNCH
jgi:hypothetical protein